MLLHSVFVVCRCPRCFRHFLFVLVKLRCLERDLRRSVLLGPVDCGVGVGLGEGGLRRAECPPLPLSSCCLLVVLHLLLTTLSSCWIDVTLLQPHHHHPPPLFFLDRPKEFQNKRERGREVIFKGRNDAKLRWADQSPPKNLTPPQSSSSLALSLPSFLLLFFTRSPLLWKPCPATGVI